LWYDSKQYLEEMLIVQNLPIQVTVSVLAVHDCFVTGGADGKGALEAEWQLASFSIAS
jgi:hypothetical protein